MTSERDEIREQLRRKRREKEEQRRRQQQQQRAMMFRLGAVALVLLLAGGLIFWTSGNSPEQPDQGTEQTVQQDQQNPDNSQEQENNQGFFSDNTTTTLDVKYGTNIASKDINYDYALKGIIVYNDDGTPTSSGLTQVSYSTLPFISDGETWYKTAYINPYPEKEIISVEYKADTDDTVNILEITY